MQPIDLTEWRRVFVTGADAKDWLQDLVSAGIDDSSQRSLLLTPTGRIRADFHVLPREEGYVLVQDPIQPKPIDGLLSPYILSSDVELVDRDEPLVGVWRSDGLQTPDEPAGMDLEEFDQWRIHEGIPRFGVDLDEDSLPQEAGWERFIDSTKGCFMGQEAMAKIRNMHGHPTRVVRPMRADEPAAAGEAITADGRPVGLVTSAAQTDLIVRIAWGARGEPLTTGRGIRLSDRA